MVCEIAFSALTVAASAWYDAHPQRDDMIASCEAIMEAAETHGVDPVLAIAVGWKESRWLPDAEGSAGEVGAMQIVPGYHCPDGLANCDVIDAGVRALGAFTSRAPSQTSGLCAYNTGRELISCQYSRDVGAILTIIETALESHEDSPPS